MRLCQRHPSTNWQTQQEPSSTHRCERSKARKTGAQLRDNRRSAKNDAKCVKKPNHRHHNASDESCVPVSVVQQDVHDSGGELNLRHQAVEERRTCRCMITGTLTTAKAPAAPTRPAQQGHRPLKGAMQLRDLRSFCARSNTGICR